MDVEVEEKPFFVVKTLTDRSIKLDYNAALTVSDVKDLLRRRDGMSEDTEIRLVHNGKVLQNSTTLGTILPPIAEDVKDVIEASEKRRLYWFYYEPTALLADPIDVVSEWDAKNRMRIFKGLYCFSQRRFLDAANLLCDSLSTFAETDFIPFVICVKYAVVAASFTLDRPSLLKKVLRSSEVLEVFGELPQYEALVKNLYDCRYSEFFKALAAVESDLKDDWLAGPHYRFICRELRIVSYNQMLTAYKSLSLQNMATSFGVSADFIERELRILIASGRLRCSIDQVAGLVLTRLPDRKSAQFVDILSKADVLINDMNKLSHLVQ